MGDVWYGCCLGVEEIVASGEGNAFFFQLYVDKQRHKTEAVLKQLESLPQVKALFVTADLAVVSKREADERIKTQVNVSVYQNGAQSAVRRAALERWAREGSREVDEGRESIREWAAQGPLSWRRERLLVRGRREDIETFLSSSGLVLFIPLWEPPSHDELMVLMILHR